MNRETTPFGWMLRLYLADRKITTREFAKAIGISASTVTRICQGKEPDLRTWRRLSFWMFGDAGRGFP